MELHPLQERKRNQCYALTLLPNTNRSTDVSHSLLLPPRTGALVWCSALPPSNAKQKSSTTLNYVKLQYNVLHSPGTVEGPLAAVPLTSFKKRPLRFKIIIHTLDNTSSLYISVLHYSCFLGSRRARAVGNLPLVVGC